MKADSVCIYNKTSMRTRKIKLNNPIEEVDGEIILPSAEYKTIVNIRESKVFTGRTMPIPVVMIEYLWENELKIFAYILKHHRDHGCCLTGVRSMAQAIGITYPSVSASLVRMQHMNIIYQDISGRKRNKIINWEAIQKFEDMVKDMKTGVAIAVRKKAKDRPIDNLPQSMLREIAAQFTIYDDPIENEEYN